MLCEHSFVVVFVVNATNYCITENRDGIYHLVAYPFSAFLLSRPKSPKYAFGEHMSSAKSHLKSESTIMFIFTLFFKSKAFTFGGKCSF